MKIQMVKPITVEIFAVRCKLPVRYEEEDIPNNFPHLKGDMWDVTIDIDTGQIRDWPKGTPATEMNMKVCDEGSYYLLDASGETVWSRVQDYVVRFIPQEYGDYIIFDIDEGGVIKNWKDYCTPEAIQEYVGKADE